MALFDFLKKKKEIEKAKPAKSKRSGHLGGPASIPPKADLGGEKPIYKKSTKSEQVPRKRDKKTAVFSYDVVKEPHISEKSTILSESNLYVFKVYSNTNKIDIKNAVEGVYGVDVLAVNIVKIPKKKRRLGKVQGFKAGYAKAIVKIQDGQKIEIL